MPEKVRFAQTFTGEKPDFKKLMEELSNKTVEEVLTDYDGFIHAGVKQQILLAHQQEIKRVLQSYAHEIMDRVETKVLQVAANNTDWSEEVGSYIDERGFLEELKTKLSALREGLK